MTMKVKRLGVNAVIPSYAKEGDSGMDVRAAEAVCIEPHTNAVIKTNLAVELPKGYEIQVRPRSGLAKRGIVGSFGTVDNGYRGDIGVNLFNHSDKPFVVEIGDRIGQLVIMKVERFEIVEVAELSDTERGADGFGSTGVK